MLAAVKGMGNWPNLPDLVVGIGTLVATRGAGLIPNRTTRTPSDPYRTIADRG